MTLTHVMLLRHGETDWNREFRMQGHTDIALNAAGVRQAEQAAPSVAAWSPDVIVASDLARAAATADRIAALTGLPVRTDARLRETNLGHFEGLRIAEIEQRWPDELARWTSSSATDAPHGGESRAEVAARAAQVVAELDAGAAQRALLVMHGGVAVGLTALLLGLPHPVWDSLVGLGNCHWVVLHRGRGRWRLHTYNGGLGGIVWPGDADQIAGT